MLNRVVEIGRLAGDPELKYTTSGIAVAKVTLAVNRRKQDEPADFIPVVLWRQSAEFAANYCQKGTLVAVDGRLQVRSYVAQDGTKKKAVEIVAENFVKLDPKRQDGSEQAPPPQYGGGYVDENAPPTRGTVPPAGAPPQGYAPPPAGYAPPPPPQGQTYTPPPAPQPPPVQGTPPPPMQPGTPYPVMPTDEQASLEDPFADD